MSIGLNESFCAVPLRLTWSSTSLHGILLISVIQGNLVAIVRKVLQDAPVHNFEDSHVWKATWCKRTSVKIFLKCSGRIANAVVVHLAKHGGASLWKRESVARQIERDALAPMQAVSQEKKVAIGKAQSNVKELVAMMASLAIKMSEKRHPMSVDFSINFCREQNKSNIESGWYDIVHSVTGSDFF